MSSSDNWAESDAWEDIGIVALSWVYCPAIQLNWVKGTATCKYSTTLHNTSHCPLYSIFTTVNSSVWGWWHIDGYCQCQWTHWQYLSVCQSVYFHYHTWYTLTVHTPANVNLIQILSLYLQSTSALWKLRWFPNLNGNFLVQRHNYVTKFSWR